MDDKTIDAYAENFWTYQNDNLNRAGTQGIYQLTDDLYEIGKDSKIPVLCQNIKANVPSAFSCLQACELFSDGFNSISTKTNEILDKYAAFSTNIIAHCEIITNNEIQFSSYLDNMVDLQITNDIGSNTINNVQSPEIEKTSNDGGKMEADTELSVDNDALHINHDEPETGIIENDDGSKITWTYFPDRDITEYKSEMDGEITEEGNFPGHIGQ